MGKSLFGLLLLLSAFALVSCGPEKSAHDRELDQFDKTVKQEKAENDKLSGWYLGTIDYMRGGDGMGGGNSGGRSSGKMCMYLYSISVLKEIPNRGIMVEVATLGAYLYLASPAKTAGGTTTYAFNSSSFNTNENVVRLSGNIGSSVITSALYMEINVAGPVWVGTFFAPRFISRFTVTKTNEETCIKEIP